MLNLNLNIAVNDRVWLWCLKIVKLRVYATETSSLGWCGQNMTAISFVAKFFLYIPFDFLLSLF